MNVSKVEAEGDLQTLKQFLPEVTVGMVRGERQLEEKENIAIPSSCFDLALWTTVRLLPLL